MLKILGLITFLIRDGGLTNYPLTSTTIPANAASWTNTSGTSFVYVITVPGTYNYHCEIHYSLGMTGSFTASGSSVGQGAPRANARRANHVMFVNAPAPGKSSVSFFVPSRGFVTLEVFDLLGHTLATPVNQIKEAGTYTVMLKSALPARGFYFVKLAGDGEEMVRTLRVVN